LKRIKVALVGFGYWGPNFARNIASNLNFDLAYIVDMSASRRKLAEESFQAVVVSSHDQIEKQHGIDLVIICTQPSTHLPLVQYFSDITRTILIMKPCGTSLQEAISINEIGKKKSLSIYCDLTYIFSPLIEYIRNDSKCSAIISEMTEYTSYRTSLGIVQADVDVLADLAVHDLSILLALKNKPPISVNCLRTDNTNSMQIRSAFLTLTWDDGFRASIHVGWNSPKKVRQMTIMGNSRAILIEELNQEIPLQIINFKRTEKDYGSLTDSEKTTQNVSYYLGESEIPVINRYESLAMEISCIAQVIQGKKPFISPPTSANSVTIWKILESLQNSVKKKGATQIVL